MVYGASTKGQQQCMYYDHPPPGLIRAAAGLVMLLYSSSIHRIMYIRTYYILQFSERQEQPLCTNLYTVYCLIDLAAPCFHPRHAACPPLSLSPKRDTMLDYSSLQWAVFWILGVGIALLFGYGRSDGLPRKLPRRSTNPVPPTRYYLLKLRVIFFFKAPIKEKHLVHIIYELLKIAYYAQHLLCFRNWLERLISLTSEPHFEVRVSLTFVRNCFHHELTHRGRNQLTTYPATQLCALSCRK